MAARPIEKDLPVELQIEKLVYGGDGLARMPADETGRSKTIFVPFVLLLSESRQPAAVSIFSFFGQHGVVAYGQLAAFSILYSLPVLALYVIVARGAGSSFAVSGAVRG